MKVLWLTNTPANADEYLNNELKGTGGWLKALDLAIQQHVELHVAFYHESKKSFMHKMTTYHTISNKNSVFSKLLKKITIHIPENDDLENYIEIINKVNPDLIHIHGTENAFGCLIGRVATPIVVSIQGNITVYYHKFFNGIEKEWAFKKFFQFNKITDFPFFKSYKRNYYSFKKMRKRELESLKNCKNIIGRTHWDFRITRILAPLSNYYQGEELLRNAFYQYAWKNNFDKKLIIHTTNGNSPYKGFETICQSLALLNKMGVDVEWRVAGINETDLIAKAVRKKLQKDFPKKGLVLLGSLNEKMLVEKMLEANLYVMPSHIENSPNNLCEAMMLGMPSIATFVGGVGSLIKDGEEGILIQAGDPWAMAGAILELANNKEKAMELGKNARKKALERHDKEKIVAELISTYNQIINDSPNNK